MDGVPQPDQGPRAARIRGGTSITSAFTEATVVSARSVTRIPDGVPDPAAAAFGVAHRTAYHVLRSVAALRPGERLIVLGAGGGGDLAEPALRTLGYGGRFVTVGYASGTVPKIPLNLVPLKGCRVLGFQARSFGTNEPKLARRDEDELLALLAAGQARPHIGATFTLAETAAALRHVADGKAIGKVVLEIG